MCGMGAAAAVAGRGIKAGNKGFFRFHGLIGNPVAALESSWLLK
jgi:hypothetical protein